MATTLQDIARATGVGTSTVSKVLNGYRDIAPETRQKILSMAEELGYRRKAVNQEQVKPLKCVGLLINKPTALLDAIPFVHNVLEGLSHYAAARGIELRLYPFVVSQEDENRFLESFSPGAIDGLILIKAQDPVPINILRSVQAQGLPIVFVGATNLDNDLDLTCIAPNNMAAAHRVVNYLYALGHRRIYFLADSDVHAGYEERYMGYCQAMRRKGLSPGPESEAIFPSAQDALQHAERILTLPQTRRPTAIFACQDQLASDILRLARKCGLSVPGDLSVVGFDDLSIARLVDPPLTTNRLPCREMGELALAEIERLSTTDEPIAIRHNLSCTLVIRESTGNAL